MARLHSSLGDRTVYTAAGLAKAQGLPAKVYEDPQGTVLANLAVYDPTAAAVPGAAITGAALVVDAFSNRPAFWDLNDRDVLYITVAGGPLEPIRPDAQPQVTALAAAIGASAQLTDARGDLLVGTADNTVARLPVGADRRVLAADSSQPTGIRWTDPLGLEYVTTNINGSLGTGSNAWPTANDARYARVLGSGTISKIGLEVTAQSGSISVAVYSKIGTGINAKPGARIATSGAIACPPVGYVEISLGGNVAVRDGDYLALSCDNATAAFRGLSGATSAMATVISYAEGTAHPLPPTATPVASSSRIPQLIGIP